MANNSPVKERQVHLI